MSHNILKSNSEQAVASWIDYLNQQRMSEIFLSLNHQKDNLFNAMKSIEISFEKIENEIIERNRGGEKGMHGFIAEIAECGIGNARERIKGNADIYVWINDNSPTDLLRNGIEIQQKFVNSGGHLSLQAVKQHLAKYPTYLSDGGKYQIPKNHYEKIMELLNMPKEVADKLPTSDDFSLKQWKEVHTTFESGTISIQQIEPSFNEYRQVQKNTIAQTMDKEKVNLKQINDDAIKTAYEKSKPTFKEVSKASIVAATIEGGTTLIIEISKKIKSGKRIGEFTSDDWLAIGENTGVGFGKGGVRGASIYALTNFTATPASVANALTTASFGVADLVYKYNKNTISEIELYEDAQILCLDAMISALSALIGQVAIPIPVLGAVIGNTLGSFIYKTAKDNFDKKEESILLEYASSLKTLDEKLANEYSDFIENLNNQFERFIILIEKSFSPNVALAFESSAQLALNLGVAQSEVIDSKEKLYNYFLD